MINFEEAFEALEWLETKCYVESPQDEKFEECVNILKQTLINAHGMEKELEFFHYLFKSKLLPASKKYIDEEAPFFKLTFAFEKDSEAYKFIKEILEND